MNKLTLAVAAYNIQTFIEECLASIGAQTVQDFDLTVVDDGSKDDTGAILDRLTEKYPQMKLVHQQNAGISCVRNRIIEECQTEYLWMIDGDDTIAPDSVERLLPCLDGKRDAVYFGNALYGKETTPLLGKVTDLADGQIQALRRKSMLRDSEPLIQPINANSSVMCAYRTAVLMDNHVRFEPGRRVGGDVMFTSIFLRAAKHLAYLDARLYIYRVNEGSVSLKYQQGIAEHNMSYLRQFDEFLKKNYPGDQRMADLLKGRAVSTACASVQLEICHPHNPHTYAERRAQFKKMMAEPQIQDALATCPQELCSRNVKLYRFFMRHGWFAATNAFAHVIMNKRYYVFGKRGGKVRK